jgi:hypothetical protein
MPSPLRAWLIVAPLWSVACFNYAARIMLTTMHGSVVAAIPVTETQFGSLTSAFLWAYRADGMSRGLSNSCWSCGS